MLTMRDVCPKCFSETHHSILMHEENGKLKCPRCKRGFVKDQQGFYKHVSE
ncbi:MAG: hypothetical protein JW834_00055 [Candidatus Diapherotrites archaeon]|nr:hypothetical protein [Candidatus Diapherotrites archaeon]